MQTEKLMEAKRSGVQRVVGRLRQFRTRVRAKVCSLQCRVIVEMRDKLACEKGQGTTEYAILVGVLVVIAILAITVFRPKLEELWTAISTGIQGL